MVQGFYNGVPEEARHDFDARNQNRARLESNKIKGSFEVISMREEDSTDFYADGGWKTFREKYPRAHGIWVISLPGINREHDRALLYVRARVRVAMWWRHGALSQQRRRQVEGHRYCSSLAVVEGLDSIAV